MKLSALALLTIAGTAAAGKPSLTINVQDGNFADIGGLDPTVSWSASTSTGDVELEYGIEAAAKPTTDIASLPKNVWGKASTDIGGWGVSARAEFEGTDFTQADIDIDAVNDDISVNLQASAGEAGFSVSNVKATKSLSSDGADITISPNYNIATEAADVTVTYDKDGTNVEVSASQDAQSVTISRQIDDDNRVAPTINSDGDLSVEWERNLGDDNSLTATVTPNDSVDLEWKDDSWTANINLPLDGTDITGTNVSIKREVQF